MGQGVNPLNLTTNAKQMATSLSCSPKWLLVIEWQREKILFSLNSSHLYIDINIMLSKLSHPKPTFSLPFLLIYMQKLTCSKDLWFGWPPIYRYNEFYWYNGPGGYLLRKWTLMVPGTSRSPRRYPEGPSPLPWTDFSSHSRQPWEESTIPVTGG